MNYAYALILENYRMVSLYGGYLACGPQAGRLAAAKIACGSRGAAAGKLLAGAWD